MVVNDNNPWLGRDVHDTRMRNDVDVVRLCLCGDRPGDKTTGNAASETTGKSRRSHQRGLKRLPELGPAIIGEITRVFYFQGSFP